MQDFLSFDSNVRFKRYVYAGFEHPADVNCANLLTWHAVLVTKGGKGSIVRVITARKGV